MIHNFFKEIDTYQMILSRVILFNYYSQSFKEKH